MVMCRDVSAMATDYMEGALNWRKRLAIRMHLAACDGCRTFLQQMRRTVRLIGRLPAQYVEGETEARILSALPDTRPPPP